MATRYWIGIAARDHVMIGVEGGFCQLAHGKKTPVKKLSPGDWLIYYAPKTALENGKKVQAFVAIGQVKAGDAYEHPVREDFKAWRRDIDYKNAEEAPIHPLLDDLSFIDDKRTWGLKFRRSVFEITRDDFEIIVEAMQAEI